MNSPQLNSYCNPSLVHRSLTYTQTHDGIQMNTHRWTLQVLDSSDTVFIHWHTSYVYIFINRIAYGEQNRRDFTILHPKKHHWFRYLQQSLFLLCAFSSTLFFSTILLIHSQILCIPPLPPSVFLDEPSVAGSEHSSCTRWRENSPERLGMLPINMLLHINKIWTVFLFIHSL